MTEGQWEKKKIAEKDRDKIRERERRGWDAFVSVMQTSACKRFSDEIFGGALRKCRLSGRPL